MLLLLTPDNGPKSWKIEPVMTIIKKRENDMKIGIVATSANRVMLLSSMVSWMSLATQAISTTTAKMTAKLTSKAWVRRKGRFGASRPSFSGSKTLSPRSSFANAVSMTSIFSLNSLLLL